MTLLDYKKISKCEKEKCKKTKTVASKYRLPYEYLIVPFKPPTYAAAVIAEKLFQHLVVGTLDQIKTNLGAEEDHEIVTIIGKK